MGSDRLTFTLYLMGMLMLTMMVNAACLTLVARIALQKTEKEPIRTLGLILERAGALQLLTVIVVISAVFVLRMNDSLSDQATTSIFSAIAGFVLGGASRARTNSSSGTEPAKHAN